MLIWVDIPFIVLFILLKLLKILQRNDLIETNIILELVKIHDDMFIVLHCNGWSFCFSTCLSISAHFSC